MANLLTALRLLCGPAILLCPAFSRTFFLFYLIGGITDAIDGTIARRLGQESEFGAKLDTAADTVFFLSASIKIISALTLPRWLLIWAGVIALIKAVNIISGFAMQKRYVTVHSGLNKICGVFVFLLLPCLGFLSALPVKILVAGILSLCTVAAVAEGHLIRTGKA